MKQIALLDLTPELFIEFCKASKELEGAPRRFKIIENALPDDAEVVAVRHEDNFGHPLIRLEIASAEFPEGCPTLPSPIYQTVY